MTMLIGNDFDQSVGASACTRTCNTAMPFANVMVCLDPHIRVLLLFLYLFIIPKFWN